MKNKTDKKELQEKLAGIVAFEAARDFAVISDNDARMVIKQMQKTFNFAKELQANTDVDVIDEYVETKLGQTANDAGKLLEKLGFEYKLNDGVNPAYAKKVIKNGATINYALSTQFLFSNNNINEIGLELVLNALSELIENNTYDDIAFTIEHL